MELTEGSETSENHNLTPGKYPKEHIQYSKQGESLKSRIINNKLISKPQKKKTRILLRFKTGQYIG
jgi:hypothetical protein